jgi:Tol biopolymer transport system component/predicted Ser/Thr protein kinase
MIGETIASYRITEKIGAGGMGEVYRATDSRLGRDVAIKFSSEQFSERFEREARAVAALNHPNICTLFDVGPNYLVMELVEGPTLAERITQGPVALDEALNIARQIASALEAAHEKGIVHRDLKPGNVKVKTDGTVKVLDFGLAKMGGTPAAKSEDSPTMSMAATQAGVILGTAAYMSPEQARGKPVDKHADIWAFGVVLFEMLTGRRLFDGTDISETLASVIKEEPDWSRAPYKVRRLLRRCLEKDPKNRLHDIRDMNILLEETPEASATTRTSRIPWAAVGTLAAALAVASWGWWASRPREGPLQPSMLLNVDLGADVSLGSLYGAPQAVISPDGKRVVYVSRNRLVTRRLDEPNASELIGTEGAWAPFFSPDGQWVAFFTPGKLKKISVAGGATVELCLSISGRGGTWGDDDTIIASLDGNAGLFRVPSGGGSPVPVTELAPGELTHRWPQILPGGKALLFTASQTGTSFDAASIEVQSLADKRHTTVQRGATYGRFVMASNGAGYLTYVSHGALFAVPFDLSTLTVRGNGVPVLNDIAYSAQFGSAQLDWSRNGTLVYQSGTGASDLVTIQWLDGTGKARPLLPKPGLYQYPVLSPVDDRLAVISTAAPQTVSIYDWRRDRMLPVASGGAGFLQPLWTPDARYLLARSFSEGMFWVRSDGAGKPQQLLQSKNVQYPRSFTGDGKRLAFDEVAKDTSYDIWTVSIENDGTGLRAGKPELFLQTPHDERNASFSKDGRWLAYTSNESGVFEVYVKAFPDTSGGRWKISESGGVFPRFSPNGRELFFQSPDNRLMVVNYTVRGDSFDSENPRVWSETRLAAIGLVGAYDFARDGKSIAAILPVEGSDPQKGRNHITFAVNFADEIRRRLSADTGTK